MQLRRRVVIGAIAFLLLAAAIVAAIILIPSEESPTTPEAAPPAVTAEAPQPEPELYPGDTRQYDVSNLPPAEVFSVIPDLPLDSDPTADALPLNASSVGGDVPVFAAPGGTPVARLPKEQVHNGTTVPVVEQHESWVKVLLSARSGLPSEGVAGQTAGWLRTSDVVLTDNPYAVTVNLSTGQIAILNAGTVTYETTGFAYGTAATPTPVGRTFIMTTVVDNAATYARGYPIVGLANQSPTLDGFAGASAAVTAFHYHDHRQGSISNGCIRVDPDTITQLGALPLGTPVIISQ